MKHYFAKHKGISKIEQFDLRRPRVMKKDEHMKIPEETWTHRISQRNSGKPLNNNS